MPLGFNLHPAIVPLRTGVLEVGGGHALYWEESGNLEGIPVVFLHGGPGAGAGAVHRRFFDPRAYRIVIFDQRGSGRSKPVASVENNTTDDLVEDVERLRRQLGIERWLVFGGSWGATLGLVYAIRHPEHCLGLVLRGVFLGMMREVDWFLKDMGTFFPEAWRAFVGHLPIPERDDLLEAYFRRLTNPDPDVHMPAARAWCTYENSCSRLIPGDPGEGFGAATLALARIEAHYFRNRIFLPDGYVLDNADRLKGVPGVVVQGRYDVVCPPISAHSLARAWPDCDLRIVPDAGHSAFEPGILSALVEATERFKAKYSA